MVLKASDEKVTQEGEESKKEKQDEEELKLAEEKHFDPEVCGLHTMLMPTSGIANPHLSCQDGTLVVS